MIFNLSWGEYLLNVLGLIAIVFFIGWYLITHLVTVEEGYIYHTHLFGKYKRTLNSGLSLLSPFETISYKLSLKESSVEIERQHIYTKDSTPVHVGGVVFFQIEDSTKIAYSVDDYTDSLTKFLSTELRSVVSNLSLEDGMTSRELIQKTLESKVHDRLLERWGISITSFQISGIKASDKMEAALEGKAIASRQAEATRIRATADAEAIKLMSEALGVKPDKIMDFINTRAFIENYAKLATSNNKGMVVYSGQSDMLKQLRLNNNVEDASIID